MKINPYLHFAGTARAALESYAGLFGGSARIMTFADGPPEFCPPGCETWVMHGEVALPGGQVLMASDVPPAFGTPQNAHVFLSAPDEGAARSVFAALAEGGSVQRPIGPAFWSPLFGMLTDRFGTEWMISIPEA